MKQPSKTFARTALSSALLAALSAMAQPASADMSMEDRFRALEARMNALEAENVELKAKLKQTSEQAVAASEQAQKAGDSLAMASGSSQWADNTRFGGYGELHYNNLNGEGGASDKKEIDLHRFVLFFGHSFNERTRFFSELEVEHGFFNKDSGSGEIELEQAYVEYDLNADHRAKAGVFLVPVGMINENHEPPVFYGVERNPVEKDIIPATWWAGGAGLSGNLGAGLGYDFAIHEGLATTAAKNYKPRDGRQKTSEANANDLAYTARLKWTGIPGFALAGSFQHQSDITQGADPNAGSANLYEVDGVYNQGPFTLKALYAQWNLDGSGPKSIGADKQKGWYVEPSFKLSEQLGVFARYNLWDNKAGDSTASQKKQIDVGVNYWLHPDVVVKADYQQQDNDDGKNQNGFNLGVGYMF